MYKKCQIVIVPSNKPTNIVLQESGYNCGGKDKYLYLDKPEVAGFGWKHIHFLSNDLIRPNDWIYHPDIGLGKNVVMRSVAYIDVSTGWRKLIASTDTTISKEIGIIPQYFVKQFCQSDKSIEEVKVEFIIKTNSGLGYKEFALIQPISKKKGIVVKVDAHISQISYKEGEEVEIEEYEIESWVPRISIDNEIIIEGNRESYSPKEAKEMLYTFAKYIDSKYGLGTKSTETVQDWWEMFF